MYDDSKWWNFALFLSILSLVLGILSIVLLPNW
jgi:hypothetical protein